MRIFPANGIAGGQHVLALFGQHGSQPGFFPFEDYGGLESKCLKTTGSDLAPDFNRHRYNGRDVLRGTSRRL